MVLLSLAICGFVSAWLKLACAGTVDSRPVDVHDGPSSQRTLGWQTEDQGPPPDLSFDRLRELWEAQQAYVELPTQTLVNIQAWRIEPGWKPVSDQGQFLLPGEEARMTIQMISVNRELARRQARYSALQQNVYYGYDSSESRPSREPRYVKRNALALETQEEFALADMHGFGISQALEAIKLNWRRRIFFTQYPNELHRREDWLVLDVRRYPPSHHHRPYRGKVVFRLKILSYCVYIAPDDGPQFANIYAVPIDYTKFQEWEMMKPPKWLERAENRAVTQS